jgi:hypothetical protein
LEGRLAYRIQELAYGGLSREALERLRALAKQYATREAAERKTRPVHRPIVGTKLEINGRWPFIQIELDSLSSTPRLDPEIVSESIRECPVLE